MILDNLEKIKSSYDICIVGAGASGLVISEKLSKKHKILIIEGVHSIFQKNLKKFMLVKL